MLGMYIGVGRWQLVWRSLGAEVWMICTDSVLGSMTDLNGSVKRVIFVTLEPQLEYLLRRKH